MLQRALADAEVEEFLRSGEAVVAAEEGTRLCYAFASDPDLKPVDVLASK